MASAVVKNRVVFTSMFTLCSILIYAMLYGSTSRQAVWGANWNCHHFNGTDISKISHHSLHTQDLSHRINQAKPYILSDSKLANAVLAKQHFFNIDRTVKEVNCRSMIKGNFAEMKRARRLSSVTTHETITPDHYIKMTDNCSDFISERGYVTDYLTEVEKEFPISFSVLMFKDVEQSERLLRAIYRPQNIYCIHVDSKSGIDIYQAMLNISNCFENVFIASKLFNVEWGTMTVLEPDLLCMEELWNKSKTWKYFINLTGQEFPLRTNYELVQILKSYNGANDIEAVRDRQGRWKDAGPPPHGIIPTKGSVHIVASRGYVDFMLHDQKAHDFLNWTRNTKFPDETFFATLNHNPMLGVPGSYKVPVSPDTDSDVKPFAARFINWDTGERLWPCKGRIVRQICVFGVGDLPLLSSRRELFANKFYLDAYTFPFDCMEELHFNHTRDEYLGKLAFNATWYAKLDFVLNKVD